MLCFSNTRRVLGSLVTSSNLIHACSVSQYIQGSPSGYGWLDIPGVSQVEKLGNRCPLVHIICTYEPMRGSLLVVPSVAVGMSVYCTRAFEVQRNCGLQSSGLRSGWHTKAHTHTHENTVCGCHEGNAPCNEAAGAPWRPQRTELGGWGVINIWYTAADSTA